VAALLLSSCTFGDDHQKAVPNVRITLDEPGHFFYPRSGPASGSMSARDAFQALLRDLGEPSEALPGNVTARFGLLTQNNTSPAAYRTPVWAFTKRTSCAISWPPGTGVDGLRTPNQPALDCVWWTFVRAGDGRYLQVQDQQVIP
jgi:hypothetical protein